DPSRCWLWDHAEFQPEPGNGPRCAEHGAEDRTAGRHHQEQFAPLAGRWRGIRIPYPGVGASLNQVVQDGWEHSMTSDTPADGAELLSIRNLTVEFQTE